MLGDYLDADEPRLPLLTAAEARDAVGFMRLLTTLDLSSRGRPARSQSALTETGPEPLVAGGIVLGGHPDCVCGWALPGVPDGSREGFGGLSRKVPDSVWPAEGPSRRSLTPSGGG